MYKIFLSLLSAIDQKPKLLSYRTQGWQTPKGYIEKIVTNPLPWVPDTHVTFKNYQNLRGYFYGSGLDCDF